MASKIRVELDNATGPGFKDIANDATKAGTAVDHLGDEAKQTAGQLDKVKQSGSDASKSLENMAKLVVSFQALKAAVQGVTSSVVALADDGSPAFAKLKESTTEAYHALLDIGNDPQVQKWVEDISTGINTMLVPSLKKIPDLLFETQLSLTKTSGSWLEYFGLIDKKQREFMELGLDVAKGARENAKEDIASKKEASAVGDKLIEMERKLAAEREAANLANITDKATLRSMLQDEIEAYRELERSGSRDVKAKEEAFKKIESLRKQVAKAVDAEMEAETKKQEKESERRFEIHRKYQQGIADNNRISANAEAEKLKAMTDEANKATDELLKALGEMKGAKGGNAIDEAKQGLDKRKVVGQVAKSRGDKAEQEQAAIEAENAKQSSPGDDPKLIAQREAQANARIRAARKKAESSAFADAKRGKLDGGEVNDAQSELINSGIKQANATGKLGDTTAQLAQEAVRNAQAQQNQAAEQQKQIDELRGTLANITNGTNKNTNQFRNQQGARRG